MNEFKLLDYFTAIFFKWDKGEKEKKKCTCIKDTQIKIPLKAEVIHTSFYRSNQALCGFLLA